MSRIQKNIGANYTGQVWKAISVFVFVPFYIEFLGMEAYGLVGFYITLMGILAFADIGLTATLTREMARLSAGSESRDRNEILRTYEVAYACISCAVALFVWVLAPWIANHWLQSENLDAGEIVFVVQLMGLSIALQLPASLYIGGLMGLQRQVLSNSLQIAWSGLRGGGSILILWLISPTILAFISWQLFSNVVYLVCTRAAIWRAVAASDITPRFSWEVFHRTWRYAIGMAGMSLVSILLLQVDKLAVSKLASLEMLGYYMLAATAASVPGMLAGPIVRAVFPGLTKMVAAADRPALVQLYHRSSQLVAVAIIPAGITGIVFSQELIFVWTGLPEASHHAGFAASLLLAGALMQSITAVPFYVALANGCVRLNLQVGLVSVALLIPLLYVLIPMYGIDGAGMSWLAMNLVIFLPYMYFLHRLFLAGELARWSISSLGRPVAMALPVVLLGRWMMPDTGSRVLMLLLIAATWGLALAAAALSAPYLRDKVGAALRRSFGVHHATP